MSTEILHFKKNEKYRQAVVGESNYQEHLERAAQDDDLEVSLFLEDYNKFDKNAVAVVFDTDTVGYLSHENAVKYRNAIKSLGHPLAIGTCAAKVIGGGEDRSYGIVLDLNLSNLEIEKIGATKYDMPASEKVSAPTAKNLSQQQPAKPKKKFTFVGFLILICLCLGAIGAILDQASLILENSGLRATRTPTLTTTPNFSDKLHMTSTALNMPDITPTP